MRAVLRLWRLQFDVEFPFGLVDVKLVAKSLIIGGNYLHAQRTLGNCRKLRNALFIGMHFPMCALTPPKLRDLLRTQEIHNNGSVVDRLIIRILYNYGDNGLWRVSPSGAGGN